MRTNLNQRGYARQKLAEMFLSCGVGEQIPTFSALQKELQVGTGTVQAAIRDFEREGMIELQAQQHYGTILISKDVKKLWKFLPKTYITGLFPEPSSLEMRGLAMGMRETLSDLNIPLMIVYGYGSKVRYERLMESMPSEDFVISSSYSFRQVCDEEQILSCGLSFGDHTFYRKDSLIILENRDAVEKPEEERLVGIDSASYDHQALTNLAFPHARYAATKYEDIPFRILNGELDGAVWHQVSALTFNEKKISVRKFTDKVPGCATSELDEAVLCLRKDNKVLKGLLPYLDVAKIRDIQEKVLSGNIAPMF